ncbi:hypothetical protein GCM10027052_20540 [Parafrigoribacterium mesophilum]
MSATASSAVEASCTPAALQNVVPAGKTSATPSYPMDWLCTIDIPVPAIARRVETGDIYGTTAMVIPAGGVPTMSHTANPAPSTGANRRRIDSFGTLTVR